MIQLDFDWEEIKGILEGVESKQLSVEEALSSLQLFQSKNRLGNDFYTANQKEVKE